MWLARLACARHTVFHFGLGSVGNRLYRWTLLCPFANRTRPRREAGVLVSAGEMDAEPIALPIGPAGVGVRRFRVCELR